MGYVKNHLATLVSGAFALVLTGLAFVMPDSLWFVFVMAVPIMWFLVFVIWIAQKAADNNHGDSHSHDELTPQEINTYKLDLEKDLSDVNAKDTEISHLKQEIENLKTKVEIETIRAEIYNLKMLAQQK